MTFDDVFEFVIKLEGGYTLHKNATEDAVTYAGIFKVAHPNWLGWTYIDAGETPPVNLVKEVYRSDYWDRINLEDGIVKGIIFEYGVNAGLGEAIRTAQRALGLTDDGAIGPKTQQAVAEVDVTVFLAKFSMERVKKYVGLANKNTSKYGIYLRGWLNRVVTALEWFEKHSA